jgi:hypothetical protein
MAVELSKQTLPERHLVDMDAIRRIVDEQYVLIGFAPDPAATALEARELALASGVRPEENLGSTAVIDAREK